MRLSAFLLLALAGLPASAPPPSEADALVLPWREAGLTEHEAAAHLLNRFAYGPRPGEVDRLVETGLEAWVEGQLARAFGEAPLAERLGADYPALAMDVREIGATYPSPAVRLIYVAAVGRERLGGVGERVVRRGLERRGAMGGGQMMMGADSAGTRNVGDAQQALIDDLLNAEAGTDDPRRARVAAFVERRFGFRDLRALGVQLMGQKVLRAAYAENQLAEVLADFWFNHFNVTLTKVNDVGPFVLPYERDAIRPHALGAFRAMLEATATHPAMLFYLDNTRSNAAADRRTLAPMPTGEDAGALLGVERPGRALAADSPLRAVAEEARQRPGVNENYARELLELHTLGVDGGYTQADIEAAARVLTGWKVNPLVFPLPDGVRDRVADGLGALSPDVRAGAYFDPRWHDAEAKTVLGTAFPAGGGADELGRLLDLVAAHPSTARHLARKLAVRFVRDDPPAALVDDLAAVWTATGGDVAAVVRALAEHPAFWAPAAVAAKVKTPFETVVSAVRATGADVGDPAGLVRWTTRMGQPLYAYQAPTGYPEEAPPWTNGAALLNRMNFGLDLALGRVDGVGLDLLALNDRREPASPEAALRAYLPLLLPGRDHAETAALLMPVLRDPEFDARVAAAAAPSAADAPSDPDASDAPSTDTAPGQLAQVVGLILGSPEFQRQ